MSHDCREQPIAMLNSIYTRCNWLLVGKLQEVIDKFIKNLLFLIQCEIYDDDDGGYKFFWTRMREKYLDTDDEGRFDCVCSHCKLIVTFIG